MENFQVHPPGSPAIPPEVNTKDNHSDLASSLHTCCFIQSERSTNAICEMLIKLMTFVAHHHTQPFLGPADLSVYVWYTLFMGLLYSCLFILSPELCIYPKRQPPILLYKTTQHLSFLEPVPPSQFSLPLNPVP